MQTTQDLITIRVTTMPLAKKILAEMGLLIDRVYRAEYEGSVAISARKVGLMGNHEPRWNEAQRMAFCSALGR